VVSIDGGCDGVQQVKDGLINATSQQYPVKMAELGVKASKDIETGGPKPQNTPGLDFYDTGVALVTDKAVPGVESIGIAEGTDKCWGKKGARRPNPRGGSNRQGRPSRRTPLPSSSRCASIRRCNASSTCCTAIRRSARSWCWCCRSSCSR